MENPIRMDDLGGPPLFLETFNLSTSLAIWNAPGQRQMLKKSIDKR